MDSNFSDKVVRGSIFKRTVGLFFLLGLVGIVFYSNTLFELFSAVVRREESSHGLFVPLLSLYFVWRKRLNLREIEPQYEIAAGVGLVAGGLLLFSLARDHVYFFWECVSLIVVLSGFVICFLGKDWLKEILFPVFFLISMIPIPMHLYQTVADWLRKGTIEISTQVLALIGIPFLRELYLIHLPTTTLKVDIGCSGIRYLLSYFVFGMAYAYLYRTGINQRISLVCLTIPISLFASSLRLTAIALLAYCIGPYMAEYWPHVITSWLVFFSVLVFFVLLDRWFILRKEKKDHAAIE